MIRWLIVLCLLLVMASSTLALAQPVSDPVTVTIPPDGTVVVQSDSCTLGFTGDVSSGVLSCPAWTPTPTDTPLATSVPSTTAIPSPTVAAQPTSTPLVVTSSLAVGTNHQQPYPMPAGWTEPIDCYLVSPSERVVDVALMVQDATGRPIWSATLNTKLNAGTTDIAASWTVPLSQPPGTYYALIVVRDPLTGSDALPSTQLFFFDTVGPV